MFPGAYYSERYFGARYWPSTASEAPPATDGGGYFQRGYFASVYFAPRYWPGGAETPIDVVPLELCCTSTESLMPLRRTLALDPERDCRSLVPVRRTKVLC